MGRDDDRIGIRGKRRGEKGRGKGRDKDKDDSAMLRAMRDMINRLARYPGQTRRRSRLRLALEPRLLDGRKHQGKRRRLVCWVVYVFAWWRGCL